MRHSNDELARTHHAFQLRRANRSGRTRIPQELWERAVSLLDHHPVTHVARQLHLDAAELRKRRLAAYPTAAPEDSPAPQFLPRRFASASGSFHPHCRRLASIPLIPSPAVSHCAFTDDNLLGMPFLTCDPSLPLSARGHVRAA